MTVKEIEKLKLGNYLIPMASEKDAAKMLAKELRKFLAKKGYHIEKDELYAECYEGTDATDFRWTAEFGLNSFIESFEVADALVKAWAENNLSVLKTAKEDKEFKKFTKAVKKHLKEEGRFTEPEEEEEVSL